MNDIQLLLLQVAFALMYLCAVALAYFGTGYLFARAIRTAESYRTSYLYAVELDRKWIVGWPFLLTNAVFNRMLDGFDWLVVEFIRYRRKT